MKLILYSVQIKDKLNKILDLVADFTQWRQSTKYFIILKSANIGFSETLGKLKLFAFLAGNTF